MDADTEQRLARLEAAVRSIGDVTQTNFALGKILDLNQLRAGGATDLQYAGWNAARGQWEAKTLPAAGVTSVFARSGVVVAVDADYYGVVAAAKTGATAASRYVGATASGAPLSGTFALGDHVIDQTGSIWICTVAGTPGTWVQLKASAIVPSSVQVLTAGTTYTTPANVRAIMVELVGAGGGGGGIGATGGIRASSGGGGSGGYTRKLITSPAGSYTYAIGTGGLAGSTSGGTGGVGGDATFNAGAIVAKGGAGGIGTNASPALGLGGAGGVAGSGGDFHASGTSGGGGLDGASAADSWSGAGGSSFLGGGAIGVQSAVGATGGNYGGGGSGGQGAASRAGGAGSNGVIVVTEYK